MAWNYDNLESFRSDVNAISSRVRVEQFNKAAEEWRLNELVDIVPLSEEAIRSGYYRYDPQQKLYISGDPNPATCESDPQEVDMRTGDSISSRVHCWEKKYRLCHKDNCTISLEETVRDKEFAVAMALGGDMFNEFWYGYAPIGTYGMFTHPLAKVSATPAALTPVSGKSNFSAKTANEIIAEIISKMRGMRNPMLAMSESAWTTIADKIIGSGDNCNRAGDCLLQKLRQSESTGGFTGTNGDDFFIMKFLDNPQIAGVDSDGVYIVWDDDAVFYPNSSPTFLSAIQNKKRVDLIRSFCSVGTIVKYADSLCVVTGINKVAP